MQIDRIPGVHTTVGEGPVWDPGTGALYLVDLLVGDVLRIDGADHRVTRWSTGSPTAAISHTTEPDRLLLAKADGFYSLDLVSGVTTLIAGSRGESGARLADAKVDAQGRFVAVSSDSAFGNPVGDVHRLEADGSVSLLGPRLVIANGPCWSLDGATFYVADSAARSIYAYDYDAQSPTVGAGRVFADLTEYAGIPDGATVDDQDRLWVAVHGTPYILCFAPDGRLVERIELPTLNITSVMFGGADLDELWVTSLDPTDLDIDPELALVSVPADEHSGALFVVRGLGARGVPEPAAVIPSS